ncbi:unnamed protein product [Coregonus sp. 'balchen']|nr:unnamed protein product [Coregonus sp. 'balchen']
MKMVRDTFWNVYVDGDQCKPNPCLHGGSCKDGVGGYTCSCTELYHGKNCEIDNSQCPTKGPFSCDHFCSPKFGAYQCSCTTGYKIHSDKRSCIPAANKPNKHSLSRLSTQPLSMASKSLPYQHNVEQGELKGKFGTMDYSFSWPIDYFQGEEH